MLGDREVVIEPVGDRRTDRVPRPGPEPADRLREHVRGRVPEDVETVVGRGVYGFDRDVADGDERQVAQLAVDPGRQCPRIQHAPDGLAVGELDMGAVGQRQLRHGLRIADDLRPAGAPRYS